MLGTKKRLTFEGRETTVEDQFEIAEVTLSQDKRRQGLGLCVQFGLAGQIAGEEVLKDAAMRSVGHFWGIIWERLGWEQRREGEDEEGRKQKRGEEQREDKTGTRRGK